MDSEEYLEELHKKLNTSKYILLHYISLVGANEENIIDYALNADCAVVRKDKGFEISYTAKMINDKDQRISDLEAKLAELKEKAIVPKFKIGQNIFFIDNECQITQGVVDVILTGQDVFEKWCKYSIDLGLEYEDDIRFVDKDEEEIFATKEEAQAKLKEMNGNE